MPLPSGRNPKMRSRPLKKKDSEWTLGKAPKSRSPSTAAQRAKYKSETLKRLNQKKG